MSGAELFGLIVVRAGLRLPRLRAAARGEALTAQGWLQIAIYVAILTALTPLLGAYMARVYRSERVFLTPVLGAARAARPTASSGSTANEEQDWKAYARTTLVFSALFWLVLYLILRTQGIHPFNPEGFDSGPWDVSFNTAVVVRHQHELAVLRRRDDADLLLPDGRPGGAELRLGGGRHGRARRGDPRASSAAAAHELGNFWQDLDPDAALHPAAALDRRRAGPRLPGRVQTLGGSRRVHDARRRRADARARPGRLADRDQAARHQRRRLLQRQLGDAVREPDGALQLRRDAVHPPDPGGADRHLRADGRQPPPGLGDLRGDAGRCSSAASASSTPAEQHGSPAQHAAGARRRPPATARTGGNLEGKEQRFGIAASRRCGRRVTTVASNGSVNSALDSYTGVGGAVPLVNMLTGEVIFGGVGSGLYGMLLFVLLAVFIAGLMVGPHARVPGQEDRGARDQARRDRDPRRPAARARASTALAIATKYGSAVDLQHRARRASPRRSTPTSRRPTTTAPRSPATPASSSPTRPATSAPSGSPSPTCSAA